MIQKYYQLTKPGIVFGNAITTMAGFFLASKSSFDPLLFLNTMIGLCLIVASGCVMNNYLDRFSDQKMNRTKQRALVQGTIPLRHAIFFGWILFALGSSLLFFFTTLLATLTALIGVLVYVGFYTLWKYKTVYGTEIGSIAGAIPPLVGYSAVTGSFDLASTLLFLTVALWQMPHFFAIAIYRKAEYASASIPVLPLKKGIPTTKVRILWYLAGFLLCSLSLSLFGFVGRYYLIANLLLGSYWLFVCLQGFKKSNDTLWARKVFLSSLSVILGLCAMIALDTIKTS